MTRTRIYGLRNCDTCRKAMKALPEAEFVDVRSEGVPEDLLRAALTAFGRALVNTRSTTWRGLNAEQREAEPMALLQTYPSLMKRPLIEVEESLFLSWNSEVEAEIKALL